MECCISAFQQKQEAKTREDIYRVYVTDCLQIIAGNTAANAVHAGGQGKFPKVRYWDILNPKPEETRTPEEIKQKFLDHFGKGEVTEDGCI